MIDPSAPTGRVAVVTGGTSGIGAAIASRLADAGGSVYAVGRRAASTPGVTPVVADLGARGAGSEVVDRVVRERGALDVLVNNAGLMFVEAVETADVIDWERMIAVNLMAAVECSRAALPHLADAAAGPRGCADLVFIGSLAGHAPSPGRAMYAATKSGLEAFANVLRTEVAETSIRISVVLPGLTDTGLRRASSPGALESMEASAANLTGISPMSPEVVADAVVWLLDRPPTACVTSLTIMPTGQAS